MAIIGQNDVFERHYMANFRAFASRFGEFVTYERDRGARDIGLHLTRKLQAGQEGMSSALCWFQMKGIMAKKLSSDRFRKLRSVPVPLKVKHLKYWFLQPMTTYLAIYIESIDKFLVLDIQKYLEKNWGRKILSLDHTSVIVHVPTDHIFDDKVFSLILKESDIKTWMKVFNAQESDIRLFHRDYDLIWSLGTASKRKVKHKVVLWDWQSKTRTQLRIEEKAIRDKSKWKIIRHHFQYLRWDLETLYPYIMFFFLEEQDNEKNYEFINDNYYEVPQIMLSNGDSINGENISDEYLEYQAGAKLNELGWDMFSWIQDLVKIGLVEINTGKNKLLSVAPWHHECNNTRT
jgi:hypothetical protein